MYPFDISLRSTAGGTYCAGRMASLLLQVTLELSSATRVLNRLNRQLTDHSARRVHTKRAI